jgi:hypothetical protein
LAAAAVVVTTWVAVVVALPRPKLPQAELLLAAQFKFQLVAAVPAVSMSTARCAMARVEPRHWFATPQIPRFFPRILASEA